MKIVLDFEERKKPDFETLLFKVLVVAIVDHGFKIENQGSASVFDLSLHDQRLPQQPYSRTSSGSCALIRHIKYVSKIITLQLKTIAF